MVAKTSAVVRDYIVRNPSASNNEVAQQTGASLRTVTYARGELRRLGIGKPAYGDRGQSAKPAGTVLAPEGEYEVQTHADLKAAVEADLRGESGDDSELPEFTIPALKKSLWRVMHRNSDDRVVVAAASALARIQSDIDARPLGPGAPMTKADVKVRLKRILSAVGLNLVSEVLEEMIAEAPTPPTEVSAP